MPQPRPFSVIRRLAAAFFLALAAGTLPACGEDAPDDRVAVGLLLSYSGHLAANSTSSERAVQMAIEAGNAAGALNGRGLRLVAGDTRSDLTKVDRSAEQLLRAQAALFIGPDTADLAVQLKPMLMNETLILPSYATAHSPFRRPIWWFVMGAGTARVACELHAQLMADGRKRPLVVVDTNGYDALLAWELTRTFGVPHVVLPVGQGSNKTTVHPITAYAPDAYVLAALPSSASSLIFALTAVGAIAHPSQWYLSPTLHTPALLENIPKGALDGARGVAPGTVAGAQDFSIFFQKRWQDEPLDDAYPFYDAGAVAVLALERALAREGTIPKGSALAPHVRAVTQTSNKPIRWNELALGIELLRAGEEVGYLGLSGPLEFDLNGQTPTANANWWTIGPDGFVNVANASDCK